MKYLREISQIVTRYREKNPDLIEFSPSLDDPDQISKLYLGLKDGKISSDLEASQFIYGSPIIDSKYTTLKNRLKKKMLNLLFFLDIHQPAFSEFFVARYQNAKSLFSFIALTGFGARNSSVKLAEGALNQALKYNLTLNALQYVLVLRNYSRFSGSERQYDKYDKQLKDLLFAFEAEIVTQELYERLTIRFTRSLAEQPDLEEVCSKSLSQVEGKYSVLVDSFNYQLYYYRLKVLTETITQDFQSAIVTCDEAIKYFDKNPHLSHKGIYGEFLLQKLGCYLHLKEYEEGANAVNACLQFFSPGVPNWFWLMEYRFLLDLHTYHFSEAEEVFIETINQERYQFLPEDNKEKWQLYELYLDFALRRSGLPNLREGARQIDPHRFLRSVPTFKKDKKGYNIPILILQLLLLLEQNDFDGIISRMDALRTYRNRYLQVGTNRKSALFFKMLHIMELNSFDPALTKLKAKKYVERMSIQGTSMVEVQDNLQILPFEWLWETITKMLEEKQRQGKIQKMT
jgi:hypothetical protein